MNFVEFCISQGYKAYRKVYNPSSKKWGYIESFDTTYFSSSAPGYIDIRLIKDGAKEIVYGIPGVYTSKDGDSNKTHFPTLIYPNPFGEINEVDRAFGELSFEEILNEIENCHLKSITTQLPNDCTIYPSHDLESSIGFEKENNPYLKKHLVVLTGAGISKESGLSTFRDKDGMWQNVNAQDLASIQGYRRNRAAVLDFYNARRQNLLTVEPNHAHYVLAELEKEYNVSIITQNVDDLHERAGSTNVLHLHGELRKVTGSNNPNDPKCIVEKPLDEPILVGEKAADGSQMRPYIVFFGENVPNMIKAKRIAEDADIFVVIGTSLMVYPAANLIESVLTDIPQFVIDPSDSLVDMSQLTWRGFTHIQKTAVAGIDILREKLKAL